MSCNHKLTTVDSFIDHFHRTSPTENLTETFSYGCCYWFAYILCSRFSGSRLMYDQVQNHFMAKIDGRLFDITGDVTDTYPDAEPWATFDDDYERDRIQACCINFTA